MLAAQIVLVGIGVIPNTQLADQLGLTVDNGDRAWTASRWPRTAPRWRSATAPTCPTRCPGRAEGERIRLESVNNAIEHAKVAAYSLTGPARGIRRHPVVLVQPGATSSCRSPGCRTGYDQTVLRRRRGQAGSSASCTTAGDQVIAADCVNAPLDFMAVKNALAKGQNIPADAAADPATPLKTITTDS